MICVEASLSDPWWMFYEFSLFFGKKYTRGKFRVHLERIGSLKIVRQPPKIIDSWSSKARRTLSCHLVLIQYLTYRWEDKSPEREEDLFEVIQQMGSRPKTRSQKAQVPWVMTIFSWQDPYNCGSHHHPFPLSFWTHS